MPTRTLAVTYNGLTLPTGLPGAQPIGRFVLHRGGDTWRFETDILITADTAADFATSCATLESTLAAWDKAFSLTLDSQTHATFDPATGTGLRARPTLTKQGDERDAARSRVYRFVIEGEAPATDAGHADGFRDGTIRIATDATGRLDVTLTGTYTTTATDSAESHYADGTTGAAARAATVLATLGGNYERVDEQRDLDDARVTLAYTLHYRERLIPETAAGGATSLYVIESLTLTRDVDTSALTAHSDAGPLTRLRIDAEIAVDHSLTTHTALADLYANTVAPFLHEHVRDTWLATGSTGGLAILDHDETTLDTAGSRINVRWTMLVPASPHVQITTDLTLRDDRRLTLRKRLDGREDTFTVYAPGRALTAIETIRIVHLGEAAPSQPAYLAPAGTPTSAGWWLLHEEQPVRSLQLAADTGTATRLWYTSHVRAYQWVEPSGTQPIVLGA